MSLGIHFHKNGDYLYDGGKLTKDLKPYTHSGLNKQIPFLALFNNLGAYQNEDGDKVIVYGMPGIPETQAVPTVDHIRFTAMLNQLGNHVQPVYFKKGKLYHVAKGALYEVGAGGKLDIHMLAVVDTDYIWEMPEPNDYGNIEGVDYSRFKLLVSSKFLFGGEHKVVVKKMITDYFPSFTLKGIGVEIVDDISKRCFAPITVRANSFTTIEERIEYFKGLNQNVLYGETTQA